MENINLIKKNMFKTMLISYVLRPLIIPIFMVLQSDTIVTQIGSWKTKVEAVLDAAMAICVIGGGFIIFMQYMQGNDQAQKNFIKLIIGVAIMKLITYLVGMFALV
jgi:hypothetical protein